MSRKYFVGYDFNFSDRTGRLHNIGLEPYLQASGWVVLKPGMNEGKVKYWLRILWFFRKGKVSILYFMPSYKVTLLLVFSALICRHRLFLGIRDLWYGNPQPISTKRGRIFRALGYYVFWLASRFITTKFIVISSEMKDEVLRLHPFIKDRDIIESTTGTEISHISFNRVNKMHDAGYFGTFDLQMDYKTYQLLKQRLDFIHYGKNDFGARTDGYLQGNEVLNEKMSLCRSFVVFGVDDRARLNRKIFHYLLFDVPIFYFGPLQNVTFRILSQYDGVFINPSTDIIKQEIAKGKSYKRDIKQFTYENIGKNLANDLLCHTE